MLTTITLSRRPWSYLMPTIRSFLVRLWHASPALTATGGLMLAALAVSAVGLWLDPRSITGAPAWLKPAKFAVSIAIYCFTLAWVFTHLAPFTRTRLVVGWATAIALVLELVIIDLQAWRGTTSHFNVETTLDAVLFVVMGAVIVAQTLTSAVVAVALWRAHHADRALGWALRLGMTVTIVGALTGGLMTRPTSVQLAEARAIGRMPIAGAHTVGAADGGPGLPVTGWSREHGDLRVAHFIGLHALQALPLFALALPRRWTERARVRGVLSAAGSYAALFGIVLWQAVRGQSIVAPDPAGILALTIWAVMTGAAMIAAARPAPVHDAAAAY